jgi:hypothetical protein
MTDLTKCFGVFFSDRPAVVVPASDEEVGRVDTF